MGLPGFEPGLEAIQEIKEKQLSSPRAPVIVASTQPSKSLICAGQATLQPLP
tara:strand:+ start:4234 stop:4389 length:156 start_codon:yes stop_codon:yes gene_type:complete